MKDMLESLITTDIDLATNAVDTLRAIATRKEEMSIVCGNCDGSGGSPNPERLRCGACMGTGKREPRGYEKVSIQHLRRVADAVERLIAKAKRN